MSKHTNKKNNYNLEILIELEKKWGVKRNYIQKAIRGERTGTIPLKIKEEYKALTQAATTAIKSKMDDV